MGRCSCRSWGDVIVVQQSGYRKHHEEAWRYLLQELRPDIATVQEAVVRSVQGADGYIASVCDLDAKIDAGAAVLVRSGFEAEAMPAPLKAEETYIAAARVVVPAGAFVALSIHVNPGKVQKQAFRSLTEKLRPALGSEAAVIAGDFNAARRYDEVHGKKLCRPFFDGMAAAGFRDAHWDRHGVEVQTFWGHQAKEKYQEARPVGE
jgi:endonuclease/exonuclease/phosphatase family metal-dependent hydrolase